VIITAKPLDAASSDANSIAPFLQALNETHTRLLAFNRNSGRQGSVVRVAY
jgi:hypothetical protein